MNLNCTYRQIVWPVYRWFCQPSNTVMISSRGEKHQGHTTSDAPGKYSRKKEIYRNKSKVYAQQTCMFLP